MKEFMGTRSPISPIQQALKDMNARISFLENVPVLLLLAMMGALLALSALILARRWSTGRIEFSAVT